MFKYQDRAVLYLPAVWNRYDRDELQLGAGRGDKLCKIGRENAWDSQG